MRGPSRVPLRPTNTADLADGGDRRALGEPAAQRLDGLPPDRHDARLAALAQHADRAVLEVEIDELETQQFREPQPGRVEELHDRLVAQAETIVGTELEQSRHRVGVERDRQAALALWRLDVERGVGRKLALADQEMAERADRRKPPLDAARSETAPVTARGEAAHVLLVELRPLGYRLLAAIVEQRGQVARVALGRQRGQLALVAQALQEAVDAACQPGGHAARASNASLTISPMRTRKSVLIVGR